MDKNGVVSSNLCWLLFETDVRFQNSKMASSVNDNDLNNLVKGMEDMDMKAEEVVDTEVEGTMVSDGGAKVPDGGHSGKVSS